MAKNKMSFWAVFILVLTIISTVMFAISVIGFATGIGPAETLARQEAVKQGLSGQDVDLAVALVVGALVAAFAISSILDVFQIVGGFLFSLKGRWGIFCIVMAILSAAGNTFELISAITNKSGALTIVSASIMLVVSVLLVVACFKHRAENRA